MDGLWGVALGGGLTLVGTGLAESLRSRSSSSQRREERLQAAREFTRTTIDLLQIAATEYRSVFRLYESALRDPSVVPNILL